jgi:hypothetical protein
MNDLLGSWEQCGVGTFIILTAHGHDPHQEALSTLRTRRARVFTVDVFALDFAGYLETRADPPMGESTSLMLYLARSSSIWISRGTSSCKRQMAGFQRRAAGSVPASSQVP